MDFGGEWYTGGEGYVGLTLFNKRISGFTVNGVRRIPFNDLGVPYDSLLPIQQAGLDQRGGPNAATVDVQTQVNADGVLNIRGTEAIWVQPLDRLVDGLGFSVNYTHVTQSSEGEGIPAVAVGVAPTCGTAPCTGKGRRLGAPVLHLNDDMVISGANQNGIPYARLNADARGQLDLSASYTLESLPSSRRSPSTSPTSPTSRCAPPTPGPTPPTICTSPGARSCSASAVPLSAVLAGRDHLPSRPAAWRAPRRFRRTP